MNLKTFALAALMLSALPVSAAYAADTTYATLHASEPAIAAGQGRIYFYREDGLLGVAIQPTIMIDGVSAGGRAKPGDYFYIDRPAGTYVVSTETEKKETRNVTVVAGEPVYVKFEVSMGLFVGHVLPSVVDSATAAGEIKDCDWHEPKAVDTTTAPATSASAPTTAPTAPAPTTSSTTPTAPTTAEAPATAKTQ